MVSSSSSPPPTRTRGGISRRLFVSAGLLMILFLLLQASSVDARRELVSSSSSSSASRASNDGLTKTTTKTKFRLGESSSSSTSSPLSVGEEAAALAAATSTTTTQPKCITRDEAFGIELTVATGGNSAMEGIDGTKIFALSALFGPEIADYDENDKNEEESGPIQLATPKDVNMTGCEVGKDSEASEYKNKCVVIKRGGCTFETKAQIAQNKGAKCVIIVSEGDDLGSMTCDSDSSIDIPVMNVIEKDGKMLTTAYELDGTVEMRKLKDGIDFYGNGALLFIAVLSITLGAMFSVTDKFYSQGDVNENGSGFSGELSYSTSSSSRSNSASPSPSKDSSPNGTPARHKKKHNNNVGAGGGSYGTANEGDDQPLIDEESGQQQQQQQRRERSRSRRGTSRRRRQQDSSDQEGGLEITEMSAVYFVLFSSLVLVVLFYSMDHWIFVAFRLLFCLAALQGLSMMLFELITRIFGVDPHKTSYDHTPLSSTRRRSSSTGRLQGEEEHEEASSSRALMNKRIRENKANFIHLPFFGNVHYLMIPSVILGGILVSIWLMFQSEEWAWVLQDIMGVAFLVNVMRLVHLPNLKIATLLLGCAMSYDIFWVYIQPHLFGKESVMVNVARGGDQHESLPMLFMFPRIGGTQGEYSMLGYGDVILPGLLIVHNALFENRFYSLSSNAAVKKMRYKYFLWSIFAYSVGMILTFIALYLQVGGQGGQPALTYLVPTTVLTTVLVAWTNGELKEMWEGGGSTVTSRSGNIINNNSNSSEGESQGLL